MENVKILSGSILLALISVTGGYAQESGFTFLALGDSYTVGESVSSAEQWPVQLAEELKKQDIKIEDPFILAATGWSTLDLRKAMTEVNFDPPYDLVSLLIGVNDQYQNLEVEDYQVNFRYLLAQAIELAGNNPGHVLVLSIPDYGTTPFGQQWDPGTIAEEIDTYNSINKHITDSMGAHYINITPVSRQAVGQPELVADDGLHPSGIMYGKWVEEVMKVLLPEIRTWKIR